MKDLIGVLDFSLSAALCISQLMCSLVKTLAVALDSRFSSDDSSSFDEFLCAFWVIALCGCLTKRRYIMVFNTMAMFYLFVQSFRWTVSAHYGYYHGAPLTCTKAQHLSDPSSCRRYDIMLLITSVVATFITITASVLSSLRLWSDKPTLEGHTFGSESSRKSPMIGAFRYSIDD